MLKNKRSFNKVRKIKNLKLNKTKVKLTKREKGFLIGLAIRKLRKRWLTNKYFMYPKNAGRPRFFDIYKRRKLKLIDKRRFQIQVATRRKEISIYYNRFAKSKKNVKKTGLNYLFFKRSKNNIFFTVTNKNGDVICSKSAGHCQINTKKKKRSPDTLKSVSLAVAENIKLKNVKYIRKLICKESRPKIIRSIYASFKKIGVTILQLSIIRSRPHGLPTRKRKLKRM